MAGQGTSDARPIGRAATAAAILAVAALAITAAWLGLLKPLDNGLTDWRFAQSSRAPTGSIVLVEIDPASLRQAGIWPWPRRVYAEVLDRLMAMGAAETVLDVDFSSASTEADDTALEGALNRAGGYASLAAFRQFSPATGKLEITLPLDRFRKAADAAVVNVIAEPDGIVRTYPAGMTVAGKYYPSLAEALSGRQLAAGDTFDIDFGISAATIDRISVASILDGTVDPRRIAAHQVVLAATAQELRDFFTVPRFGTMPGGLLQILAAETLKQHRELSRSGIGISIGLLLMLAALFYALRRRGGLRTEVIAAVLVIAIVEVGAYVAQAAGGVLVPTAGFDLAVFGYLLVAILQELESKRRLHAAAARARDAMQRILDRVIADNFDGVVVIDEAGIVLAVSGMAQTLLGAGTTLVGRPAQSLPEGLYHAVAGLLGPGAAEHPLTGAPSELTLKLNDERRTLEYVATRSDVEVQGGEDRRVVCLTFRDISDRRHNEQRLAFLARHDPLTGALSRLAFVETVEAFLATETGQDQGVTIAMVDLGRLRSVNDMFGHALGDQVLRDVVGRLDSLDLAAVARIGGDSFAVARRGVFGAAETKQFGLRIVALLVEPYVIDDRRAVLLAHAGLTNSRLSGRMADSLLTHADMALSDAKVSTGNVVEVFVPAMTTRLLEKQEMEAALRHAIAHGEFEVHYQPQVRLSDRTLVGVEALLRWHHPTLGTISPVRFIPAAEETGLILELGRFVLETACREVATWPESIRLAVNVSPVQFELGDVLHDVRDALALSGLDPGRLDIEITEGLFVDGNHPARLALERVRKLGVGVALDDFGTGYSSLAYLSRLPADKLKIDRSFISDLPADGEALAIVKTVLTLAQVLGKGTVAEGIETEAQATLMQELACDVGQGYLFGKALTAVDVRRHWLPGVRLAAVALAS